MDSFGKGEWNQMIGGLRWAAIVKATLDLRHSIIEENE
jgi:hypothetical protein